MSERHDTDPVIDPVRPGDPVRGTGPGRATPRAPARAPRPGDCPRRGPCRTGRRDGLRRDHADDAGLLAPPDRRPATRRARRSAAPAGRRNGRDQPRPDMALRPRRHRPRPCSARGIDDARDGWGTLYRHRLLAAADRDRRRRAAADHRAAPCWLPAKPGTASSACSRWSSAASPPPRCWCRAASRRMGVGPGHLRHRLLVSPCAVPVLGPARQRSRRMPPPAAAIARGTAHDLAVELRPAVAAGPSTSPGVLLARPGRRAGSCRRARRARTRRFSPPSKNDDVVRHGGTRSPDARRADAGRLRGIVQRRDQHVLPVGEARLTEPLDADVPAGNVPPVLQPRPQVGGGRSVERR